MQRTWPAPVDHMVDDQSSSMVQEADKSASSQLPLSLPGDPEFAKEQRHRRQEEQHREWERENDLAPPPSNRWKDWEEEKPHRTTSESSSAMAEVNNFEAHSLELDERQTKEKQDRLE